MSVARWVYDAAAPLYDAVSTLLAHEEPLRRRAVEALALPRGGHALDLGCGTGLSLPLLSEALGPLGRVTGVDVSARSLDHARRRAEQLGLAFVPVVGDAATAEWGGPFDGALAVFALSVVPDWRGAIARAAGALVPSGRLAVLEQGYARSGWARLVNPLARSANWVLRADAKRDFPSALRGSGLRVASEPHLRGLYALHVGGREG